VEVNLSRGSEPFHILLLADSLSFQGPQGIVSPIDPRLYPNVMARELSRVWNVPVHVHTSAREGWTAREAWWALTKDPLVYADWLTQSGAVVIGVGGMDQLPAVVPTYLRDSLPYIRPGALRRKVRRVYRALSPKAIALTGGIIRQLPPEATSRYMTRMVQAIRAIRGNIPIVAMTPSPYEGHAYPSQKFHSAAREAMLEWGNRMEVNVLDIEDTVIQERALGGSNPDGLHWGWSTHDRVGTSLAHILAQNLTR
jgi:diglucosylglycerate octanoyltransferase